MNLIFVYGTLKHGGHNHHFMVGQTFVGNAHTVPGHALFDLGGYPGIVAEPEDTHGVSGEVWSVDDACLAGLDVLEGTAEGLYRRSPVPLKPPFANQRVEAYYYLKSTRDMTRVGEVWQS
jgi:gamma-glutamylcyclotransferase (GGCT)/AIG2-like uncharacterized protein YtfP